MDCGVVFKIVARYLEAFSVKESLVRRGGCASVRGGGEGVLCESGGRREGCACVRGGGRRGGCACVRGEGRRGECACVRECMVPT